MAANNVIQHAPQVDAEPSSAQDNAIQSGAPARSSAAAWKLHDGPGFSNYHAGLADVALIDASTCAASGGMGLSWWHDKVANGIAPQPVVRLPRCTRWRLVDVRAFWIEFASKGVGVCAAQAVMTTAKRASSAAMAKRLQQRNPAEQ